jgi:hypothetical protein
VTSASWSRSWSIGRKAGATTDDGSGSGSGPNAAKGICSIKAGSVTASTGAGRSEETSGSGASAGGAGSQVVSPEGSCNGLGDPVIVEGYSRSAGQAGGIGPLDTSSRAGSGANSTCATTPPAPPPAACGRIGWDANALGKGSAWRLADGAAGLGSGMCS